MVRVTGVQAESWEGWEDPPCQFQDQVTDWPLEPQVEKRIKLVPFWNGGVLEVGEVDRGVKETYTFWGHGVTCGKPRRCLEGENSEQKGVGS